MSGNMYITKAIYKHPDHRNRDRYKITQIAVMDDPYRMQEIHKMLNICGQMRLDADLTHTFMPSGIETHGNFCRALHRDAPNHAGWVSFKEYLAKFLEYEHPADEVQGLVINTRSKEIVLHGDQYNPRASFMSAPIAAADLMQLPKALRHKNYMVLRTQNDHQWGGQMFMAVDLSNVTAKLLEKESTYKPNQKHKDGLQFDMIWSASGTLANLANMPWFAINQSAHDAMMIGLDVFKYEPLPVHPENRLSYGWTPTHSHKVSKLFRMSGEGDGFACLQGESLSGQTFISEPFDINHCIKMCKQSEAGKLI